jgi:hypothetical protein
MERTLSEIIAQIESEIEDSLVESIEEESLKAKFFSPCRVYTKREIEEINKRLLKVIPNNFKGE